MKKIINCFWRVLGAIYFPVYVIFWLLHKVARIILAVSYFGMLDKTIGKDIIKQLFIGHGKH